MLSKEEIMENIKNSPTKISSMSVEELKEELNQIINLDSRADISSQERRDSAKIERLKIFAEQLISLVEELRRNAR